jgi:hypothetical protein
MSKVVAISKKDKALAVKSMTTFELAACERKAVLQDLKTEIENAPVISLENGEFKQPDAKGWQLKISNKIIKAFGNSCKDIDRIENVFLSNAVRNIRLEMTELWKMFKDKSDFSETAYNNLLLKADELIESAKEHFDNRMEKLGL